MKGYLMIVCFKFKFLSACLSAHQQILDISRGIIDKYIRLEEKMLWNNTRHSTSADKKQVHRKNSSPRSRREHWNSLMM